MAEAVIADAARPGPLILGDGLHKVYDNGTEALKDVHLEIAAGEFVSLLGPSGCGKSTLLRMIAGLEQPSNGVLRWWNRPRPPRRADRERIAMVFQEPTLMPWATALGNVRLPLELAGLPEPLIAQRSQEALTLVGLAGFEKSRPRELSGGMQMRVAIARALATEPDLLLMDEPFGALDEFTRNRLDEDLRAIWRERRMTVVFVTHSIYEAVFLSQRVVVMAARPGRVLEQLQVAGEGERGEDFRHAPAFVEACRQLSQSISLAHRSPAGAHS